MKKVILIVSLALNALSFTTTTESKIINTLEDMREWLEQDIEAALDHGDKAVADKLEDYKMNIDNLLTNIYNK